jgi:hypothetical protein
MPTSPGSAGGVGRLPRRATGVPDERNLLQRSWRTQSLPDSLAAYRANRVALGARTVSDRELITVACRDLSPSVRQVIRQAVAVKVVGMTNRCRTSSRIFRGTDQCNRPAFRAVAVGALPVNPQVARDGARP